MSGTYNTPYRGEALAPEHLFQSIPHAVSSYEVIDAASELTSRATGIVRLLTTNAGCLNERDTFSGMVALEAVIDQLAAVLQHKTHDDVVTAE